MLKRERKAVKKSGAILLGWFASAFAIIVALLADLSDPIISAAIQSALLAKRFGITLSRWTW